ncbi:CAAX protease self-immunity [Halobiforma haloterrestris]|uniref:CAAX protease self-immunity n=1 Tax=Natronobacterium haloterrestre TaxID=148448 RepID=A0A1I1L9F3_NATHA|nr:type II CAAX endopeptidase family protein [Halobiforma haloterrestris]SFC69734.1 CAAX protease self-immunity [Halobiforma haloterrestris]
MLFVVLTYAFSWGIWGGGYLLLSDDTPFVPIVFLGVFGPAVAAAVTVRAAGGDIREWLHSILSWRVASRWYLAALLVPILVYGVAAISLSLFGASFRIENLGRGVAIFISGLPTATLISGGNEEFGWRGFLLPHLQQQYDALSASLIIGIVWAGWHLPVYILPLGLTNGPFYLFAPFIILFSILFTWLYNSTGGSIVVVMLLHGSMNSAIGIYAGVLSVDTVSETVLWATRPIGVICVTALVVVFGYEALSDQAANVESELVTNSQHNETD